MFFLLVLLHVAFHKSSRSFVFPKSPVGTLSYLLTLGHQVGPRTPDLGPDVGFIHILHSGSLGVSFISVASTYVVVSSHVVFGLDLMVLRLAVSLVSLAAMVLSLRSIYLTPNPNIGPTEAIWRLFEFDTHKEQPPVTHLTLHLPGHHAVYFDGNDNPAEVQAQVEAALSTLIAFFAYNMQNEDGRQYLYHEFPEHFVYIRKVGWRKRQKGISIGRMYSARPFMGDRYYLRLLLTVVRGATSFDHLKTVDGRSYPTFKSACIALGLLEDDGEWGALFREGAEFITGRALRHLFALALQHTTITNPLAIWETFGYSMCDDVPHLLTTGRVPVPQGAEEIEGRIDLDYGLYLIQEYLKEFGKSLSEYGLPEPVRSWVLVQARHSNLAIED